MTNPYGQNGPSDNWNSDSNSGGMPSYGDYTNGGAGSYGAGYDQSQYGQPQYGQPQYDPNAMNPAAAYPGAGRRLGAILIDTVLFGIVVMILAVVFLASSMSGYMDDLQAWTNSGEIGPEPTMPMGGIVLVSIISVILWFAYRVGMEVTTGKTVGKMALRIKVVDAEGNLLSAKNSFIRNSWYIVILLGNYIPFVGNFATIIVYAVLGILIARDPHKQHICDQWAKAYVINAR